MFQLGHYCRAIANRILRVLPGLASSVGQLNRRDLSEEAGHGCGGNARTALRQLLLLSSSPMLNGPLRSSRAYPTGKCQRPDVRCQT
jgi:hypothetical protein